MTTSPDWNSPAEILAIVDEHDREIGGERRDIIHERNLLHRAVHVFVFGRDRRLLLQQRSSLKDTFPLHWECVGGHLSPGETYDDAAVREVQEELGVAVDTIEALCKLAACPQTGYEFIQVYRAVITSEPAPHAKEVIATEWLPPRQVLHEIRAGNVRLYSPPFLHSVEKSGVLELTTG